MFESQSLLAIVLGVIEGLTEFLPVSSTGHLIVFGELFSFTDPSDTFKIIIQIGAILAVIFHFRAHLISIVTRLSSDHSARRFVAALIAGTLPALVLGALLYPFIKSIFSPIVVGVMLIIGGIIMLIAERFRPSPVVSSVESVSIPAALIIGCFQTLAMIPGTSRSGATIVGGMLLRLHRKTAAEFSFFLAIPTMSAAFSYEILQSWDQLNFDSLLPIVLGFSAAFVAGLFVIRFFMKIVSQIGFRPFALYRIAFGGLVLALFAG